MLIPDVAQDGCPVTVKNRYHVVIWVWVKLRPPCKEQQMIVRGVVSWLAAQCLNWCCGPDLVLLSFTYQPIIHASLCSLC